QPDKANQPATPVRSLQGRSRVVAGISLQLDAEALRPVIEQVVEEVLERLHAAQSQVGNELCYSEEAAARPLRVGTHLLRDERLRGKIRASQIVGRRIRYTHDDLVTYLMSRRQEPRA